ncbi:MAG: hypothetical protein J5I53_08475 [Bradyrhizobiaceae bacterium]|nr:hypothetical protein [Bradyrhizobiaceae bacterium]
MRTVKRIMTAALLFSLACMLVGTVSEVLANGKETKRAENKRVPRGRYLVSIGGCNDCHTPSVMEGKPDVPESEWLTGSSLGFNGPWGTSYAWNLRLMAQKMTETEWVDFVKSYNAAPPMPSASMHSMSTEDLKSVYAFLRYLGPAGVEAPANLPPGVQPTTPYVDFTPKFPANAGAGQK